MNSIIKTIILLLILTSCSTGFIIRGHSIYKDIYVYLLYEEQTQYQLIVLDPNSKKLIDSKIITPQTHYISLTESNNIIIIYRITPKDTNNYMITGYQIYEQDKLANDIIVIDEFKTLKPELSLITTNNKQQIIGEIYELQNIFSINSVSITDQENKKHSVEFSIENNSIIINPDITISDNTECSINISFTAKKFDKEGFLLNGNNISTSYITGIPIGGLFL